MSPSEVVEGFCHAIAGRDVDLVAPYLHDEIVYHNIPLAPVSGKAAVLLDLQRQFEAYTSLEFRITRLGCGDATVLTERIDVLGLGSRTIDMPVAGVFDLRDHRIVGWRDYFDVAQFTRLRAAGGEPAGSLPV